MKKKLAQEKKLVTSEQATEATVERKENDMAKDELRSEVQIAIDKLLDQITEASEEHERLRRELLKRGLAAPRKVLTND